MINIFMVIIVKNKVFIDTSGWLALVNKKDKYHKKAKNVKKEIDEKNYEIYTSNFVIVEIANGLSKIKFKHLAVNLVEKIRGSEDINNITVNNNIFEEAWDLFKDYDDKEWGLTDCTSFIIMENYNIQKNLSNDHHFEQKGFINLL